MLNTVTVGEIMTGEVVSIDNSDNLWEIERIFRINHLRHAPVCENDELVGMISLIDLRRYFPTEDKDGNPTSENGNLTAGQIMASDPVSIQVSATIREAATLITENEFHALPVLDGDNLAGIISTTDIIRFLIDVIDEHV